MVDIGKRIKELRLSRGLTQKQLAELIGLQNTMLSFYEVGDRYPSLEILIKLARTFNVTTDYLLGVEKTETIDVSGLSDDNKKVVYDLVNNLRKAK